MFGHADEVVADLKASHTIVFELKEWTDEVGKLVAPTVREISAGECSTETPAPEAVGNEEAFDESGDADIVEAELVKRTR